MTVKIIPITPEYREGWENTFKNKFWGKCKECGINIIAMDTTPDDVCTHCERLVWAEKG